MSKCFIQLRSHDTDKLSSFESLLIFRKFFKPSSIYYDLPKEQNEFFKKAAHSNEMNLNELLNKSKDEYVKFYLKNSEDSLSCLWSCIHCKIYQCDHASLFIIN
jgi:hypothetical protein